MTGGKDGPGFERTPGRGACSSELGRRTEMMEYGVVFEKTSNGWSAYVPDLPGLGVAAATIEETEQLIREGIEFHIAGLREDGVPVPAPAAQVKRIAVLA